MSRGYVLKFALILILLVTGCSSLPGLRVLTGQENEQSVGDRTVEALDLVMGDKTGFTDPSLIAAADRIEAASTNVDVIEIRQDLESRIFTINMLFSPPNVENTLEGQIAYLDAVRRAIELSWQGTMRESVGADVLRVTLLGAGSVPTLDNGLSYIGIVDTNTVIERGAAASYLAGERSLTTFFDLIAQGTLAVENPSEVTFYEGTPNHPMFMLPADGQ
jgi:hypothetical protein